jgi:hypothetical protein
MSQIQKFMDTFEVFLTTSDLPHYSNFDIIKQRGDTELITNIIDACAEFITVYVRANLDDNQKIQMIEEYGMKRLIDLQCAYEGNSICLELLHFNEHMDTWIHVMLMNIISLYWNINMCHPKIFFGHMLCNQHKQINTKRVHSGTFSKI